MRGAGAENWRTRGGHVPLPGAKLIFAVCTGFYCSRSRSARGKRPTMRRTRRLRRTAFVVASCAALAPNTLTPLSRRRPLRRGAGSSDAGAPSSSRGATVCCAAAGDDAPATTNSRRATVRRAAADDDAPATPFQRRRRPALSNLASVQKNMSDEAPPLDDDRPPTGAVLESLVTGERELYESTHERVSAGLKELTEWAGFMFKANAMGLTEQVDLSKSVKDRVRHAVSVAKGEAYSTKAVDEDADVEDDWADIHADHEPVLVDEDDALEPFERRELRDGLDLETVSVAPDLLTEAEWARIADAAFEVDTAVIDDKVMKGKWIVKDGKPTFKPWRFWPAETAEDRELREAELERVRLVLKGEELAGD